jgi:sulfofructosephosphate aldolase
MSETAQTLDAIARESGGLAMVAMDQRESLRSMYDDAGRGRPADEVLVGFKLAVAEVLGPLASGFLIDRHYGLDEVRSRALLPASTGLIVAADALTQEDGGPVEETALDDVVIGPDFDLGGASALKLLVIWRRDEKREQRVELTRSFIAAAARLGLLSVLEPVVRATQRELDDGSWDLDEAIREAARELSPLGPSLYKAQVPLLGTGTAAEQYEASRKLDDAVVTPWVVLSQGVARDAYLPAVEQACRAGASGFLAGRALWSDVVGTDDLRGALTERSVPRHEALARVVDDNARPWSGK